MPRDFITKYWRRLRNCAAKQQPNTAGERSKTNSGCNACELAAALDRIKEELAASNDQNAPEKQRERCWKIFEVIGIWGAAAVGLIAILWSAWDSSQQRGIMQGQLNEATKQRLMTVAQQRADLAQEVPSIVLLKADGKPVQGGDTATDVAVSPIWKNVGSTDAVQYIAWFDLRYVAITPKKPLLPSDCPRLPIPNPQAETTIIRPGEEKMVFAKKLPVTTFLNAANNQGYLMMTGRAKFRDAFPGTPLHHRYFCEVIIPNDIVHRIWSLPEIAESSD
jgi:hypothetical protein